MHRTQRDTEYICFLECAERIGGEKYSMASVRNYTETAHRHAVFV